MKHLNLILSDFFFLSEIKDKKKSLWVKRNIFGFITGNSNKSKVLEMKSFIM